MGPNIIYQFATDAPIALEALNSRLRKMDDDALRRFSLATAFLCSPAANSNQPPPDYVVLQSKAAREELRRRKQHG